MAKSKQSAIEKTSSCVESMCAPPSTIGRSGRASFRRDARLKRGNQLRRHHAEPDEIGLARQDPADHLRHRQAVDVGVDHLDIDAVPPQQRGDVQHAERLKAVLGLLARAAARDSRE